MSALSQHPLDAGIALDHRWHLLRGEMETDKRASLLGIAQILDDAAIPWAIIGGVALQVRQEEPRTTLDIDIALLDRATLPREAMVRAGFLPRGTYEFSENWEGPDRTPVQFTDDPPMADAVLTAEPMAWSGVTLQVATASALLRMKLRAAADPGRRRSKRLRDLADALALVEQSPHLALGLTEEERRVLEAG